MTTLIRAAKETTFWHKSVDNYLSAWQVLKKCVRGKKNGRQRP